MPVQPSKPVVQVQPAKPVIHVQPAKSVLEAQLAKPAQQVQPPKPVLEIQPTKPAQQVQPAKPQVQPPNPVQPAKPIQPAEPAKPIQNPVLQSLTAAATVTPKVVKEPDFFPKTTPVATAGTPVKSSGIAITPVASGKGEAVGAKPQATGLVITPAKPVAKPQATGLVITPAKPAVKPQASGLVITPAKPAAKPQAGGLVITPAKPAAKPALNISSVAGTTMTKPPFVDETAVTSEKELVSRRGLEITPLKVPVDHGLKMTISATKKRIITAPPTRTVNKVMGPGAKKVIEEIEIDDDEDDDDEDDDDEEDDDEDDDDDDDDEEEEDESEEEEEGSKEEDQSVEEIDVEPPQKTVRKGKLSNSSRVSESSVKITKVTGTPKRKAIELDDKLTDSSKKRGRPSRAALEERERERQEAIARGEPDPELKRKRRKPNKLIDAASSEEDPDSNRKLTKKEEKEMKKKDKLEKKLKEKDERAEGKKRRKKKQVSQSDTDDDKPRKKPGRQKKVLTEDELAARDAERKAKYQAIRDKQKEKKAKREAYLIRKRDERKAQKVEEKKRQEEHDKRMAELKAQYLDDSMSAMDMLGPDSPFVDENSQSSIGSASNKKQGWAKVGAQEMVGIHNPLANVTAETLFEYKWPMEGRNSEHYFLQEQVSEYLGVKSFKRRYPDCPRRAIGSDERDVLMEMKIVNETQADLGLTAIPSSSVLDIMCADFYDKYEIYMTVVNERKEKSFKFQTYQSGASSVNIQDAVKAAADWNKQLNHVRNTERAAAFDLQTMTVHYPKTGKGRMKVLPKRSLGNYPIALIPGQFVDSYKEYSSKQLRYLPVNTVLEAPPQPGKTFKDLLGSEGGSGDSSSDSSSDSSTDSEDSEKAAPVRPLRRGRRSTATEVLTPAKKALEVKKEKEQKEEELAKELAAKEEALKKEEEAKILAQKPKRPIDEARPGAVCRNCQGNVLQNKFGVPELLLHCSKCESSNHPTCAGLHLDLLSYVTNYNWECMECKKCMTCQDPKDEDKMLFCDLCDRGYHTDCVGLAEVPSGRWHCGDCASCKSCSAKNSFGDQEDEFAGAPWVFEMKQGLKGEKVYSHTMCQPCHKIWKKGLFCPECNGVFGRSKYTMTAKCWVCAREHHAQCVGQDSPTAMFICQACQRRTQEKTISGGVAGTPMQSRPGFNPTRTPAQSYSRPPPQAFSRSGRRVAPKSYQEYQ